MDVPALLLWYRAHRRRMPWRDEVSPYRTLVSEVMLQQTRVDTVVPYFQRFMTAFPSEVHLAAAPLERVLELWSGLGYYRRARSLHATARAVVAAGGFPTSVEGLLALPGVGPYTAGAIASIALGLDAPLVDGNVERVLCRHDALAEDPKRIARRLWARAGDLLPRGEAGDFNQALMELGATVCMPRAARCTTCPLQPTCRGSTSPEQYPVKAAKKKVPEADAVAVLLRRDGRVLLARRRDEGLIGGLWELPGGEGNPADVVRARLGMVIDDPSLLGTVTHVFTHLRLRTHVHVASTADTSPRPLDYADARWVPLDEVQGLALSTLARKTLRLASVLS